MLSVAESKMFFQMSHYEDELKMKGLHKVTNESTE